MSGSSTKALEHYKLITPKFFLDSTAEATAQLQGQLEIAREIFRILRTGYVYVPSSVNSTVDKEIWSDKPNHFRMGPDRSMSIMSIYQHMLRWIEENNYPATSTAYSQSPKAILTTIMFYNDTPDVEIYGVLPPCDRSNNDRVTLVDHPVFGWIRSTTAPIMDIQRQKRSGVENVTPNQADAEGSNFDIGQTSATSIWIKS